MLCLLPLNYLLLEHYRVYVASDLIIGDYCVLALWQQVCRVLHDLCWLGWLFDITFGCLFYRDNFCLGFLCRCGWLLGLLWLRLLRNFDFNFFKDRRVNFDLLRLFIGLLWCLYKKRFFFYNGGSWFLFYSLFNADYTSELFNWFKLILIVLCLNQGVLVKICPQIIANLQLSLVRRLLTLFWLYWKQEWLEVDKELLLRFIIWAFLLTKVFYLTPFESNLSFRTLFKRACWVLQNYLLKLTFPQVVHREDQGSYLTGGPGWWLFLHRWHFHISNFLGFVRHRYLCCVIERLLEIWDGRSFLQTLTKGADKTLNFGLFIGPALHNCVIALEPWG